jgi:hypothetical protein
MTRTFWLSFCNPDRPKGEQFVGVCVVDVNDQDAERAKAVLRRRFPNALPDAEWIAAATSKAHRNGCNPGGEVAGYDVTQCDYPDKLATCPRNQLLSRDELIALEMYP